MNIVHDYKTKDVTSLIKRITELLDPIEKMNKKKEVTPDELVKKMGTKIEMAARLIEMANCLNRAKTLIKTIHGRNFDLMGKIVSTEKLSESVTQSQMHTDNALKEITALIKQQPVSEESRLASSYADVVKQNENTDCR